MKRVFAEKWGCPETRSELDMDEIRSCPACHYVGENMKRGVTGVIFVQVGEALYRTEVVESGPPMVTVCKTVTEEEARGELAKGGAR